jgi:hypothetical protein
VSEPRHNAVPRSYTYRDHDTYDMWSPSLGTVSNSNSNFGILRAPATVPRFRAVEEELPPAYDA